MSSPLLYSSMVQGFGQQIAPEMDRFMIAFQIIKHGCLGVVLAGAALGISPGAGLMAQPSNEETVPAPQVRPPLGSFSLPPGSGQEPEQTVPQGPVDADRPVVRPQIETPTTPPRILSPRPTPAEPVSEADAPTVGPVIATDSGRQTQQLVRPAPTRQPPETPRQVEETNPTQENSVPTAGEPAMPAGTPTGNIDTDQPSAAPSAVSISAPDNEEWRLFLVAALFFILLGALYLWQTRRGSVKQRVETLAADTRPHQTIAKTEPAELLPPAPGIILDFRPHKANTTLLNAVIGFELTLANHSDGQLSDIRLLGAMGQAEQHGSKGQMSTDLALLHRVPTLGTGDAERISNEFRIPLANIRPIIFRSQALFVPLVRFSIEFTDGSGFRQFQTASYLVGLEHQPPRQKMAPFRLDMGPQSFNPLGHRPFATG